MNQVVTRKKRRVNRKVRKEISSWVRLVIGLLLGLLIALPFLWMFWCAFEADNNAIYHTPPLFPNFFQYQAFFNYFTNVDFLRQTGITLLLSFSNMLIGTLASILVAYGFSRFRFRFKKIFFGILLSTMMLPWVVTMVPAYMLFSRMGMIGTFWPLILPSIGGSAYNIFLLRQFMDGIPKELDEAAKIDGCGPFRILFQIILPNCLPILATIIIFSFIGVWGDYVGPSIYILSTDNYTLALGLQFLKTSNYGATDWPMLMAGCVIYSIPIIIVFLTCQKAYVRGAIGSAIK